jgi:hypothetical protein
MFLIYKFVVLNFLYVCYSSYFINLVLYNFLFEIIVILFICLNMNKVNVESLKYLNLVFIVLRL